MRQTVKSTSYRLTCFFFRLITGLALGLTLALIDQELNQQGTVRLLLLTTIVMAVFLKISSQWSLTRILVFDLICILVGQILKMYILLAP